jgi:hypothetical protein
VTLPSGDNEMSCSLYDFLFDIIIQLVRLGQSICVIVLTQCTSVDVVIPSLPTTALHIFVSLLFPMNGFELQ